MAIPKRIQRKRTKGWMMPPGTIYVGRPTKWGNPFDTAVEYDKWLIDADEVPARRILADIEELRGKDLACWCDLNAHCHADTLLVIANVPF